MRSERGQSSLIAVVLLIGITMTAVALTVGLGAEALSNSKQSADVGRTEQALTQFDAKASLVAHGGQNRQRLSVDPAGSGSALEIREDAGWLNMTIFNSSDGTVETVVMNATLGAFVYERGDQTVAYQGGGVWLKGDGNDSRMISSPEFHYRIHDGDKPTLTLPLIVLKHAGQATGDGIVIRSDETRSKYPDRDDANRTNPLESGTVVVTVKSEYYDAWGRFFGERTDGSADIDHGNGTASIELVTGSEERSLTNGVAGVAPGDEISLQGSGSFPAFVDAYNSSNGDYASTKHNNGSLSAAGDLDLGGNANVTGTVRSGGFVEVGGGAEVGGDVEYTTGRSVSGGATIEGTIRNIDGIDTEDPIDTTVTNKVDSLADDNDNGAAPISSDTLDFSSGSATLGAGEYYLDNIDMDGEDLTLDTSGGDVVVAVENSIAIDNGATISVQGDGQARMYIGDDVTVHAGTEFDVPNENSSQLWLYGTEAMSFDITANQGNPTSFDGVLYAPNENSDFTVGHAEVFGAVVAGDVDINTGGSIHFDDALMGRDPIQGSDDTAPTLTYLQVSVSSIQVSDRSGSGTETSTATATETATATTTATATATATATSTPADAAPTASIDDVVDKSSTGGGNPAEYEVDWSGTDDNGIDDVTIELVDDSNGNTVDSASPSASGTSASGTVTLSKNGGHGDTYRINVTVTDSAGQTDSDETTDTADGSDP